MNNTDETTLLSSRQTAELLKVSHVTLHYWRQKGVNLDYIKLGPRTIKYKLSDIKEFIKGKTYEHDK